MKTKNIIYLCPQKGIFNRKMIYYFSGTGNSLVVARRLAELTGDKKSPMLSHSDETQMRGIVGLVFPVYSWGLPWVVDSFIANVLPRLESAPSYIYAVMTCGDDMGYADRLVDRRLMAAYGRGVDAAFSVCMPNTYVCLPGFDVDSEVLAEKKIVSTMGRLPQLAELINGHKRVRDLVRGNMPWLKTYVVRPFFNRLLVTDRYFHVDSSRCLACGKCKCVSACPLGNVSRSEDGEPLWRGNCTGCLACYHSCPQHAVQFGTMTKNKGQYRYSK